ncbi:hypothetical protein [Microbacterium sp. 179-I 3D4 NHS]|uniref:hypothetical protein n=1 Tax=Microbacterium sp. 179-I 3D4 NHS TaxID=3142381 RepID=UPI0039A06AB5
MTADADRDQAWNTALTMLAIAVIVWVSSPFTIAVAGAGLLVPVWGVLQFALPIAAVLLCIVRIGSVTSRETRAALVVSLLGIVATIANGVFVMHHAFTCTAGGC